MQRAASVERQQFELVKIADTTQGRSRQCAARREVSATTMAEWALNAQSFAHLPASWTTLYLLAQLDSKVLVELIGQKKIHPALTIQEASNLSSRAKTRHRPGRSQVQRRLASFKDFVRSTLNNWTAGEREIFRSELLQLDHEVASSIAAPPSLEAVGMQAQNSSVTLQALTEFFNAPAPPKTCHRNNTRNDLWKSRDSNPAGRDRLAAAAHSLVATQRTASDHVL